MRSQSGGQEANETLCTPMAAIHCAHAWQLAHTHAWQLAHAHACDAHTRASTGGRDASHVFLKSTRTKSRPTSCTRCPRWPLRTPGPPSLPLVRLVRHVCVCVCVCVCIRQHNPIRRDSAALASGCPSRAASRLEAWSKEARGVPNCVCGR